MFKAQAGRQPDGASVRYSATIGALSALESSVILEEETFYVNLWT